MPFGASSYYAAGDIAQAFVTTGNKRINLILMHWFFMLYLLSFQYFDRSF